MVYPHCCSLTEDQALIENPRQEAILTSLGFDGTRVTAAGAALAKEDLDAYDLIVCADAAVRDAVLALGGDESYETSVRLLEDFATVADARSRALFDGLDDALAARARKRQDGGDLVVEGADAQSDRDGFDAVLESTLVLTAALALSHGALQPPIPVMSHHSINFQLYWLFRFSSALSLRRLL